MLQARFDWAFSWTVVESTTYRENHACKCYDLCKVIFSEIWKLEGRQENADITHFMSKWDIDLLGGDMVVWLLTQCDDDDSFC